MRRELNGTIQVRFGALRNRLLRITPTSKRPLIPARYLMNQQFLSLIADVARQNQVRLLLYVVPLNPQAENPYVPEEYVQFKQWLADFARREHVPCADLENTVPAGEWGVFMGGPDFKHFKGSGHRRRRRPCWSISAPGWPASRRLRRTSMTLASYLYLAFLAAAVVVHRSLPAWWRQHLPADRQLRLLCSAVAIRCCCWP